MSDLPAKFTTCTDNNSVIADTDAQINLTQSDVALINARARIELLQIVVAQALLSVVVAVFAGLFGGLNAALSSLAGSASYFLPNFLFALRLFASTFHPQGANPVTFLAGELLKIFVAVGLLWLFVYLGGSSVVWLALIAGLIAVLKGYMLVLMFGDRFISRALTAK